MRFLLSRQQVRLVIGAAMLLLIQGLLAPWSAWAGCNHLVRSHGQNQGASVNLDLDALITGRTSTEIESDPAGDLATRPKSSRPLPCSGPSCSGRVPLPVSASMVGAVNLVQWGVPATHSTCSPRPAGRNGLTKAFPISPATPPAFFILPALPLLILGLSYVGHCGAGLAANSSVESHTPCWFLGFRFPLCHASPNRGMKPSRNHGGGHVPDR